MMELNKQELTVIFTFRLVGSTQHFNFLEIFLRAAWKRMQYRRLPAGGRQRVIGRTERYRFDY